MYFFVCYSCAHPLLTDRVTLYRFRHYIGFLVSYCVQYFFTPNFLNKTRSTPMCT